MSTLNFARKNCQLVPWQPSFATEASSIPHPVALVVAGSLAYQKPPEPAIKHLMIFKERKDLLNPERPQVSGAQTEAALLILSQFRQELIDGAQPGFLLGDQTGCGKTRVACLVLEEMSKEYPKQKKALWITSNTDSLFGSVRKELNTIGSRIKCSLFDSKNKHLSERNGLVFTSYSTLRGSNQNYTNLFKVCKWLSPDFEGLMVLDEAHSCRNDITNTGHAIKFLQMHCPKARVLYMTATIGTDSEHYHYLTRLFLWGSGCPFESYTHFDSKVSNWGINAVELISTYLQGQGRFVARQLSVEGLKFEARNVILSEKQRAIYNASAVVMQSMYTHISDNVNSGTARRNAMRNFWGEHQRYFEALIQTFKAEDIKKIRELYPSDRYAMVVSLHITGQEAWTRMSPERKENEEYSLCRELLNETWIKVSELNCRSNDDRMKLHLIQTLIDKLSPQLGKTPIDRIIKDLGTHSSVAEVTGRTSFQFEFTHERPSKRFANCPLKLNIEDEVRSFQTGKKTALVLSQKGSTGISLHADSALIKRDKDGNVIFAPKQRVHVVSELTWNPEQGMQQLGRTNRSNQCSVPVFICQISNVRAEMRFHHGHFEKYSKLGAICYGERNAGSNIAACFPDTFREAPNLANLSIKYLLNNVESENASIPKEVRDSVKAVGLLPSPHVKKHRPKELPVFLNRVLGMQLEHQDKIIDMLKKSYEALVAQAKTDGSLIPEMKEISKKWELKVVRQKQFGIDPKLSTKILTILADRGVSYSNLRIAIGALKSRYNKSPIFFHKDKEIVCAFVKNFSKDEETSEEIARSYNLYTPWSCEFAETVADKFEMWNKLDADRDKLLIERLWDQMYTEGAKINLCVHKFRDSTKESCPEDDQECRIHNGGSRNFQFHIITDSLLFVWNTIKPLFQNKKENCPMEILRLDTKYRTNKVKLIGLYCPQRFLHKINQSLESLYTPQEPVKKATKLSVDTKFRKAKENGILRLYTTWLKNEQASDDEDDILQANPVHEVNIDDSNSEMHFGRVDHDINSNEDDSNSESYSRSSASSTSSNSSSSDSSCSSSDSSDSEDDKPERKRARVS